MANETIQAAKYVCSGYHYSANALRHTFKYIAAVTGISFYEDNSAPDIFAGISESAPNSSKIIIKEGLDKARSLLFKNISTGSWETGLPFDPISQITEKLSLRAKHGPHADKLEIESNDDGHTLSGLISDFIRLLENAGIIQGRQRAISLWPEGKSLAICVTHDIDIVRRSIPGSLRLLFGRHLPGRLPALLDSLKTIFGAPNPYDKIPEWNRLERELGIISTYFIFGGVRQNNNDPKYKPSALSGRLAMLKDNEIALHSSIESYSGNGFEAAKSELEQFSGSIVRGIRPHYLSSYFPDYWQAASNAGFSYSSALGYDDKIGYFGGLDLPFIPFDKSRDTVIDIVEIPIGLMDCGLICSQDASSNEVFARGKELIDNASVNGGIIVLDWHQRTLYNRDYPGWMDLFVKLIRYAGEKKACFMSMQEINALLRKRFWSSF